jgi:small subunit ribosomal protein S25e
MSLLNLLSAVNSRVSFFIDEQKWSKGKLREKMNAKVLFDEDGWKRLQDEVPKMKLITPSALVERLKINGSLARAACKYLLEVRFLLPILLSLASSVYRSIP